MWETPSSLSEYCITYNIVDSWESYVEILIQNTIIFEILSYYHISDHLTANTRYYLRLNNEL